MKKKLIFLIITVLFVCIDLAAQFVPEFEEEVDVNDTPVNGALLVMLAAGVGYGIKKLYDKRK